MNHLTSMLIVGLTSLLAFSSALPQSNSVGEQTCFDGRLCQCRSVLDDSAYSAARDIIKCLDQFGTRHQFSEGSQEEITVAICELYQPSNIQNGRLMQCVFRNTPLVVNVNGEEQWDLILMRNVAIEIYTSSFPEPENAWIKRIFITTIFTCDVDPTNFEVFPYEDCIERARLLILSILNDEASGKSFNQEGMSMIEESDLSAVMLSMPAEDVEQSRDLDISTFP